MMCWEKLRTKTNTCFQRLLLFFRSAEVHVSLPIQLSFSTSCGSCMPYFVTCYTQLYRNHLTVIIMQDEILTKSQIFTSCGKCQAPIESAHSSTIILYKVRKLRKSRFSYNQCMCTSHEITTCGPGANIFTLMFQS